MAQQYTLTCINNSGRSWTFYVYQKLEPMSSEMLPLAWLASPYKIRVGSSIKFTWFLKYNFVWGNTGSLRPGVTFSASGSKPADPSKLNSTVFHYLEEGVAAPGLNSPISDPGNAGSLIIIDGDDVPDKTFSVGIGMSGSGTFVKQAGPNLTHIYTPTPSYWIAAGNEIQIGTVLNTQTISNTSEVRYSKNIYDMIATINDKNQWDLTIDQS